MIMTSQAKPTARKFKFLIILQTKKGVPTLTWYGILDWSLFVLCLKISFFFIIEEMSSCLKWLLTNSKCYVTFYKMGCIHKSFERNWGVHVKHDPSFPGNSAKTLCLKLAGWVIDFSGLHLNQIPRTLHGNCH